MKIYKNPWVSNARYYVPTGKAYSGKMETAKTKGVEISFWNGKWEIREAMYYKQSLKEMPIVGNINLKQAILHSVLRAVCYEKENCKEDTK